MKRAIQTLAVLIPFLIVEPGCSDNRGNAQESNGAGTAGSATASSGGTEAVGGAALTGGTAGDGAGGAADFG